MRGRRPRPCARRRGASSAAPAAAARPAAAASRAGSARSLSSRRRSPSGSAGSAAAGPGRRRRGSAWAPAAAAAAMSSARLLGWPGVLDLAQRRRVLGQHRGRQPRAISLAISVSRPRPSSTPALERRLVGRQRLLQEGAVERHLDDLVAQLLGAAERHVGHRHLLQVGDVLLQVLQRVPELQRERAGAGRRGASPRRRRARRRPRSSTCVARSISAGKPISVWPPRRTSISSGSSPKVQAVYAAPAAGPPARGVVPPARRLRRAPAPRGCARCRAARPARRAPSP